MNALLGVIQLDGKPVHREDLIRCIFKTPKWTPDHQTIWVKGSVGLISTQRFVTPECSWGLMPYEHPSSKSLILSQVYLTHREDLILELALSSHEAQQSADCKLILLSYLKWGRDCVHHLKGHYLFAIWDQAKNEWFIAVDPFSTRPCFFTYQKNRYLIFANYFSPFRILCDSLSINQNLFAHFALDAMPLTETCYREVQKLPRAGYLYLKGNEFHAGSYWSLKKDRAPIRYRTREDYYEHFRELFERAVRSCLRTDFPVHAHISGGLDSTSIACVAARLLGGKNRLLHGFTSIPVGLEGPSYNPGWYYHELSLIEKVLKKYSNIQHDIYQSSPETDIFDFLKTFYPHIDQPIRNVSNMDWYLASFDRTLTNQGRVLLSGDGGNGTISWGGEGSLFQRLRPRLSAWARAWFNPQGLFEDPSNPHQTRFIRSSRARRILRRKSGCLINPHYWMLSGVWGAPRQSSSMPMALRYGIELLDPTRNLDLIRFCYNIPPWVYRKGNDKVERRLLVREGLAGWVPEEICLNIHRGEQAADWFLLYNFHHSKWLANLQQWKNLPMVWDFYDYSKILDRWKARPHIELNQLTTEMMIEYACHYMTCISLCSYLDDLLSHDRDKGCA
ncbi:MAG: hypothetical protein HYS07_05345 [Chlamydiae bacterium]|nr:hypothetical protein [Chlamydiota bacterium]MBI3278012.1 hypothetical protein [Chlamydiota bacterium]